MQTIKFVLFQPKPSKGRMRIHMLENVDKCLQFLKKKEVNTVNKILISLYFADENFLRGASACRSLYTGRVDVWMISKAGGEINLMIKIIRFKMVGGSENIFAVSFPCNNKNVD